MKKYLFFFGALAFFSLPAQAQTSTPSNQGNSTNKATTAEDVANADVSITATVTAKQLTYEIVPDPKVEFPGKPERKTVWESDRRNLPDQVQPGVTYRDIGIKLRIVSRFADIDRIVAEALGEVPVSDNESKDVQNLAPAKSSNDTQIKNQENKIQRP